MTIVLNIITMAGGLALFLYGMRIMGDALKHGSSGTVKNVMGKVTNNPFMGFLIGLVVTAIIQSSTATIVITSGLVGAGILTLHQSIGIILGANVGTTVTGQIIRLMSIKGVEGTVTVLDFFKPETLAPIAAVIGIFLIMAFKFRNSDTVGTIAIGFAILFTGLLNMTAVVSPLSESETFRQLFMSLSDKPLLGFFAGVAVAFAIQSSSASVGILQTLSVTGLLSFSSVYAIIVGIYIGDCVTTAIVCSIGASADAKRTGLMHILFNLSQVVLVVAGVTIVRHIGWNWFNNYWNAPIDAGGIANVHTLFKLACAVLLLPVCSVFEKMACKMIKDDKQTSKIYQRELAALDREFYKSPALALSSAHSVLSTMAGLTCGNVKKAMASLEGADKKLIENINEEEAHVDEMADHVSNYLIGLSPHINADDGNETLNYYIKCVSEFERIGDYAINVTECAQSLEDKNTDFSPDAVEELRVIEEAVKEIMSYTCRAFVLNDRAEAAHIEPVEEVIDDLVATVKSNHVRRLRDGDCNVYAGCAYMDVLTNVERVADHCSNIGFHLITMLDSGSGDSEHDYKHYLHQGNDENYNREFKELHDKYFEILEKEPANV